MEATLNVRMDAVAKERGDKVLKENGISTSAAVRALWDELARTRTLPDFLANLKSDSSVKSKQVAALSELTGIARGSLTNMSDQQLEELGAARYE